MIFEASPEEPLTSLGLGGDGDEVDAILEVEVCFGVKLDYADAPGRVSVGDVFASLKRVLGSQDLNAPDLWGRFSQAISNETGGKPSRIVPETLLLAPPLWRR